MSIFPLHTPPCSSTLIRDCLSFQERRELLSRIEAVERLAARREQQLQEASREAQAARERVVTESKDLQRQLREARDELRAMHDKEAEQESLLSVSYSQIQGDMHTLQSAKAEVSSDACGKPRC